MTETDSNTLINAFIGAVVTVVFSFIPFSPVVGGAVAGYLEKRDGIRVGAIAGGIAAIPLILLSFLLVGVLGFFGAFLNGGIGVGILGIFVLFVMLSFSLVYTVGLSALGGYIGVYLVDEL